jgi:hypothetical protein
VHDVAFADIPGARRFQNLGTSSAKAVDQRSVRIRSESIEIAVMEQFLKSSIESVSTVVEEAQELRSRNQAVVGDGPKEFEVSVLKRKRRAVGLLCPNESRKTTTERSLSKSGGGTRAVCPMWRGNRAGNGFGSRFWSGFEGRERRDADSCEIVIQSASAGRSGGRRSLVSDA